MYNQPANNDQIERLRKGETVMFREAVKNKWGSDLLGEMLNREMYYHPHQVGDTIKLLEEWKIKGDRLYYLQDGLYVSLGLDKIEMLVDLCTHVNYGQPAHTMPEEFSRYSAIVMSADCKQIGDIEAASESLAEVLSQAHTRDSMQTYVDYWNKTYPHIPFDVDTWTFGSELKLIKES